LILRTGKVLDKWNTLTHIPLTNARTRQPLSGQTAYAPNHINSISLDIHTGHIRWVLGGARAP
jgi:hypothetical protein